jgi:hypothetical protein
MKQILHCTLIFMVLVMSGCGSLPGSSSSSLPSTKSSPTSTREQERKINFESVAKDVDNAAAKLKPPNVTVKAAKEEINQAIQKLGKSEDDIAHGCLDCSPDTKKGAVAVWNSLNVKATTLGNDPQKRIADLSEDLRTKLPEELTVEAGKLRNLSEAELRGTGTATPSSSPEGSQHSIDDPSWWQDALFLSAKIVAVLFVLVLLVLAVKFLWNRSWKTLESNVTQLVKAHVVAARDGQPDYAPKLSSLASTQADINTKLSELDTEVRSLARLVRDSAARRSDRNPSYGASNYAEDVSPKDEPEFPVSAVDYLDKMNRFANVVKPDFQNGILVNDPEGDGELVLIRDPRVRDDTQPLFVIPRATQFHTKQDFYTYYQKYYDCVRPTGGDVWIIGPAVVEKVTGGWQLREKGMLEVR